jgi:ubiquinol-cytochrome c reductase cytochrome c subunit
VTGRTLSSLSLRRRHPFATLLVLLIGLVAVGGIYAAVAASGSAQAAPAAGSQSVEKGRALFLEGCSSCHGLNAQGTSDGVTLIGAGAASVDFQVGTGRMPLQQQGAQAKKKNVIYTPAEIADLAAYVESLAPGPAIPTSDQLSTADASMQEGGELFRTNCASCHSASGGGGALTGGKNAPSLLDTSDEHIYEAMLTGPANMPVFGDGTLPTAAKQDIIAYINQLQTNDSPGGLALGRVGPVSEGALLWIVGLGVLAGAAVWIGTKAS